MIQTARPNPPGCFIDTYATINPVEGLSGVLRRKPGGCRCRAFLLPPHRIFHEGAFYVKMAGMSEPAVLYELDSEPAAPDLTIAAVAMACRMSYSSVNTAVVDFMNGARPAAGTLAHTAVAGWLAVVEYMKITGDASHSARVEAGQGYRNT